MMVFFDLDGVILDSHEFIKMCYRKAGVEPPDDLFGAYRTGWLEGLVGQRRASIVRHTKDSLYAVGIREGKLRSLPPLLVAQKLSRDHDVGLVTNAAWSAISALYDFLSKWPFTVAIGRCGQEDRWHFFREFRELPVYVDDQPFEAGAANVIRYEQQSYDELLEQICNFL